VSDDRFDPQVEAVLGLAEALAACGLASLLARHVRSTALRLFLRLATLAAYAETRWQRACGASFFVDVGAAQAPTAIGEILFAAANHAVAVAVFGGGRHSASGGGRATRPRAAAVANLDALVVAPLVEELVFRGVVLRLLLRRCPDAWRDACVTVQAVLFAVFHLANWRRRPVAFVAAQVAVAFASGRAFALATLRSGSIWDAVALHAVNNLAATAFEEWAAVRHKVLLVIWSLVLYGAVLPCGLRREGRSSSRRSED